jgi:hypothetical protein
MNAMSRRCWIGVLLIFVTAGCHQAPPSVPRSASAEPVVLEFFRGLGTGDMTRAYAVLHPDVQSTLNQESFAQRAAGYLSNLGFTPDDVIVRSCEERQDDATAHVTLVGHSGAKTHTYKEILFLRRTANGWGVLLPGSFGTIKR